MDAFIECVAKSLANVPSGDIFSTTLPSGRFARFIKVTGSGAHEGVYLGSIAIGPYLEDDRPVQFYTPDIVAADEFVLHEESVSLCPEKPDLSSLAGEPNDQPPGTVAITSDNRVMMRFRSHRKTRYVSLLDGTLSNIQTKDVIVRFAHYRLEEPDARGVMTSLFDSASPE